MYVRLRPEPASKVAVQHGSDSRITYNAAPRTHLLGGSTLETRIRITWPARTCIGGAGRVPLNVITLQGRPAMLALQQNEGESIVRAEWSAQILAALHA